VLEARLGVSVAAERGLVMSAAGHGLLQSGQLLLDRHQLSRPGQHVLAQREPEVARRALVVQRDLHVLGEHQLPGVDRRLAREHAQQRRLAGAVTPGQGHPVAALELERDAAQQRLARDVLAEV